MTPWYLFFSDKPLAFLSMDVMNLSNEPILITSAEASLTQTNGKLSREGQNFGGMSFLPQDNDPVLIYPGKKETISINIGFQLEGLEPFLEAMELDKQHYVPPSDEPAKLRYVNNLNLIKYINSYLELQYGKDASIEITLYSGIKTEVYSKVFRLGDGRNMFDNSGNIDWSAFLGELAHIKQTKK